MGKKVREGIYLRGLRCRIEEAGSNQVIEGDGRAIEGIVKLPKRVGTKSAHRSEGARIGRAGAVFSKVPRPLRVARNDGKVVRSGQGMRVPLVVDEEKGAVFQIDE